MRLLAVAVLALGCGGTSTSSGGSSGSSAPDVAVIVALADRACACKDAACRDDVHDRWKATRPAPGAAATVEHDVAYDAAATRMYGCLEPDHDAPVVAARVKALAEHACACGRSDTACLDKVKADFDRYLEIAWLLQEGYTAADKQALEDQMRSFELCRQVGPT